MLLTPSLRKSIFSFLTQASFVFIQHFHVDVNVICGRLSCCLSYYKLSLWFLTSLEAPLTLSAVNMLMNHWAFEIHPVIHL